MGTTSSTASSSGAPGGSAAPNGTSLEAALAQIEEEQLQKVRPPPIHAPQMTRERNEECRHRLRHASIPPADTAL